MDLSKFKIKGIKRKNMFNVSELNRIRVVPGFNGRDKLRNIESLMESIKAIGMLLQPIIARHRKGIKKEDIQSGKEQAFDLIDGERRLLACKRLLKLGVEIRVGVVVITCSDQEAHLIMAMSNLDREGFTPVEESNVVKRFERWGWDDEEIANRMGKSVAWVQKRKNLSEASEDLKDEVRGDGKSGEKLAVDVAADIAANYPESEQMDVLNEAKADAAKEAEEKEAQTGKKQRPNVRKAVKKKTGAKAPRPGIKDLKRLSEQFDSRGNGHAKQRLFTLNDLVTVLSHCNGEITESTLQKRLSTSLAAKHKGKVPEWWKKQPPKKAPPKKAASKKKAAPKKVLKKKGSKKKVLKKKSPSRPKRPRK